MPYQTVQIPGTNTFGIFDLCFFLSDGLHVAIVPSPLHHYLSPPCNLLPRAFTLSRTISGCKRAFFACHMINFVS